MKDVSEKLIAAAPELLEALKALASTARTFSRCVPDEDKMWTSLDEDALTAAFKAINKATGDECFSQYYQPQKESDLD